MNKTMWQVIKESFLEGEKGSGKAWCAFVAMALLCFVIGYPTYFFKPVDMVLILQIMIFICALYGIKMYTKLNAKGEVIKETEGEQK